MSGERSIANVLGDIAGNLQELVRSELRLAKVETVTEAKRAGRGVALLAVGGGMAFLGLAFLLLGGVYLLAKVVALWIAASIVGGSTALIAVLLIAGGLKQLRKVDFTMPRTTATIKENIEWAKPSIR